MMMRRAFVDPKVIDAGLAGQTLLLNEESAHRFLRVLRLGSGARVEIFDGTGRVIRGVLSVLDQVLVTDLEFETVEEAGPKIEIAQALCKMDKLEQVVQRSTELGAHSIILFDAERSVVDFKGKADQKIDRLRRIAQDAARQSQRLDVPLIIGPVPLGELANTCSDFKGVCVMGALDEQSTLSELLDADAPEAQKGVMVVIGPEGGLSPNEVEVLKKAGVVGVIWGPHVMRTETASLAALAIIQAHFKRA
jgi:16S rRNA (uracil1498-N3)-methyltransferase